VEGAGCSASLCGAMPSSSPLAPAPRNGEERRNDLRSSLIRAEAMFIAPVLLTGDAPPAGALASRFPRDDLFVFYRSLLI
jgi:hypothetical protein